MDPIPFSHSDGVGWVHVQMHRNECGDCFWCKDLDEKLEKWTEARRR